MPIPVFDRLISAFGGLLIDPQEPPISIVSNTTLDFVTHTGRNLQVATAGITLTLPETIQTGFFCRLDVQGIGTVALSPDGSATINGQTNFIAGQFAYIAKRTATEYVVRVISGEPASDIFLDTTNFDNNLSTQITDVQLLAEAIDNLTTSSLARAPLQTFSDSFVIDATNVNQFVNRELINVRASNGVLTVTLPPSGLTQDSVGNPVTYPLLIRIFNDGGTSTSGSINRVEARTVGSDTIERGPGGTQLQFASVTLGEGADIRLDTVDSTAWRVFPFGSTDPRDISISGGDVVIREQTVSLASTTGLAASLAGLTILQGYAYVVRGTTSESSSLYFGTTIYGRDVIVALTDNPDSSTTSSDWAVLRNGANFPVTFQELRFLDQVTETDTTLRGDQIQSPPGNTVQFWLSSDPFASAPFIDPDADPSNPRIGHSEEYVGEEDTFQEATAFNTRLLYVGIGASFFASSGLTANDVRIELRRSTGESRNTWNLGTDFIERTELNNSTYRYFALQTLGIPDSYSTINYGANDTIEAYRLRTERRFTTSAAYDATSSIADDSISESQLAPFARAKLNRQIALASIDQTKLDNILPQTTEVAAPGTLQVGLRFGSPSANNGDYQFGNLDAIGLFGVNETQNVVLVVDHEHRLSRVEEDGNESNTLTVTEVDPSLLANHRMYTFTIPSVDADFVTWNLVVVQDQVSELDLSDLYVINSQNLSPDLRTRIDRAAPETVLPAPLPILVQDLSVATRTVTGWRTLAPSPIPATLTRIIAGLWDENRRTFTNDGNYFDDIVGGAFVMGAGNTRFFYDNPADPRNTAFPGAQSYSENSAIFMRNATAGVQAPIDPTNFNLIVAFDFSLQRALLASDEQDVLRMGPGLEPIIEYDGQQEGLVARVGRNDGPQRTRTIQVDLSVVDPHLGASIDGSTTTEAEIIVPSSSAGTFPPVFPLTVTISVQLLNNGVSETTHEETYVITAENTDQSTADSRTFMFPGFPDLIADITYDANNTSTGTARNVIFVRATSALANTSHVYNVNATYTHTENWNGPATYLDHPVNDGNGHDRFGLFDPSLYDTEAVNRPNSIIVMFYKRYESDISADPEMAIRVITDGREFSEILLHRSASECGFTQTGIADWGIRIGNSITAVTHCQSYYYATNGVNRHVPTIADLHTLYVARARWFDAFRNDDEETDAWTLNGNLIIQPPDVAAIDVQATLEDLEQRIAALEP